MTIINAVRNRIVAFLLGSDLYREDDGMNTVEYSLVGVAAATLAGILIMVVQSGSVEQAIQGIITDALNR